MSVTDPFATAPTNDVFEENVPVPEAKTPNPAPSAPEGGVTLSFKGGSGYDASLLVLRSANIAEMNELLEQEGAVLASLIEKMAKIQAFSTTINTPEKPQGKATFQGGRVQYSAPAGGPERPANVPDGYTYKEGVSKAGKPYKAWFPPRGVEATPIWA